MPRMAALSWVGCGQIQQEGLERKQAAAQPLHSKRTGTAIAGDKVELGSAGSMASAWGVGR